MSGLETLLVDRDDDVVAVYSSGEDVTSGELRHRSEALAAALGQAGLQPGQAVGVMLPNGPDLVAALFGVWLVDGVYVPINPRSSASERTRLAAEVAPALVVTTPEHATAFGQLPVLLATGHGNWEGGGPADPTAPTSPDGVALISYTSGTTGRPKAVPLLHTNVLELIDGVLAKLRGGRPPADSPMPNLIPTSLSLWAGIYNVLFAFRAGAAVIVMDRFDTHDFVAYVERFQLRSTVLPPAAMVMLSDDESIGSLAPLRFVRSISAPLSPLQARRFRDRFGVTVLNGWGQTEIGGEIVGWSAQDSREFGDTHLGAVGRPHENVSIKIADDGEILVQTPTIVARGDDDHEFADRMVDGWFRTGDIGHVDAEGFLWIDGRVADVINRGGSKIFPEEVAEVVRLSPVVAECAVAGVPDARLGEVPWAFVVAEAGATVDADALEALCREHLTPYKVPVHFETVPEHPRNEVGKVLLRELVERAVSEGDRDPATR